MLDKILTAIIGGIRKIYSLAACLVLIGITFAAAFFALSVFMPEQVREAIELIRSLLWL